MTGKQREVLRFVEGFQAAHDGVSPSMEEIAVAMGWASKSAAHRAVTGLERQGLMRRQRVVGSTRSNARGLVILPQTADLSRIPDEAIAAEYARRFGTGGAKRA